MSNKHHTEKMALLNTDVNVMLHASQFHSIFSQEGNLVTSVGLSTSSIYSLSSCCNN